MPLLLYYIRKNSPKNVNCHHLLTFFYLREHNNEGCEDCQAPKSTVNYLCALRPSSEGLRVLDNFHRSQSPMQYQEEFILNFTPHGYTKETLVTKTDKTDTPCCVYAS